MRRSLVLFGLLLAAAPAAAQQRYSLPLEPGDEVRLSPIGSGAAPLAGQVVEWDSYMLSFAPVGDESRVVRVDPTSLAGLQIRERSRSRSAWRGAAWGLFLGGSAGLIAGPFASRETSMSFEGTLAALSAGGGISGALVGAAIGAVWAPARWRSYVFVK